MPTAIRSRINVRFEFAPVIGEAFVKEINAFERIRIAKLRVLRPNASWTEHYTELSEFMEESGGDKVEVGVRATDGKSLKRNGGIVRAIKQLLVTRSLIWMMHRSRGRDRTRPQRQLLELKSMSCTLARPLTPMMLELRRPKTFARS
jgi:hypothetical protein